MAKSGIELRKAKHKEDLRKAILDAALDLFIEQGIDAPSMRSIAERIQYSPTTLYIYFKNKNEILFALHEHGFALLGGQFQSLLQVDHPFERLKAMGRSYIRFAMENPQLYHLMMVMNEPIAHVACMENPQWDEGHTAYLVLYNTVKQCQEAGYFKDLDTHGVSLMLWSTLHGLCTLKTSGHLDRVTMVKQIEHTHDSVVTFAYETYVKFLASCR